MWVMPLTSSFWVDEAETAFVVHHGVQPSVPGHHCAGGGSRCTTGCRGPPRRYSDFRKLPSAFLRWWPWGSHCSSSGVLAARLIHPQAAWFAVFACLTLRVFNYEAADARPYALGTCVAAASLWLLIRWLDSGKWLDGILFLAAGALLWRVHLVYWPFYLVYAIYFLARSDRRASWIQVITISAGLVLALLPVAISALAMNRDAAQHVFAPLPSWFELGETFKIRLVAGCALGALIYARWRRAPRVDSAPSFSAIALIAGWWLVQPLGLVRVFAYQRDQRVCAALRVHRAAGRGVGSYRRRRVFHSEIEMAIASAGDGMCRADLRRAMERALAAASQFGLARSFPSRERPGAGIVHAGVGRQPVHRSQAAGLEPGLSASRVSVLPTGRVSGQRQALLASLRWRFARGQAVCGDSRAEHAARCRTLPDLRARRPPPGNGATGLPRGPSSPAGAAASWVRFGDVDVALFEGR